MRRCSRRSEVWPISWSGSLPERAREEGAEDAARGPALAVFGGFLGTIVLTATKLRRGVSA